MNEIPTLQVGSRQPVYFLFPLRAQPKERPMAYRRGKHVGVTTPAKTKIYEMEIALQTELQYPFDAPLEGDLVATVTFFFANRVHGDLDNCLKSILDGMQKSAYRNDKQIRGINAHVVYFDEMDEDEERFEKTEVILTHRRSPRDN